MTDDDFKRLEAKVDRLGEAIQKLILVEERQATQGVRIGAVEQRISSIETAHNKLDRKLEMWVNRGIGAWGLAVTLFAILEFGVRWVK